jgi:hypothetical protein
VNRVIDLGRSRMEVNDADRVQWIVLPDGAAVPGEAHENPARYSAEQIADYAARAHAIGYRDVWQSCVEHDALHQLVADWLGWESSVSIWWAAYGPRIPRGIIPFEDRLVLAFQAYLNGAEPDLILGVLEACGHDLYTLKRDALRILREDKW